MNQISPLRAVVAIEPTGRMGTEISSHAFWMTQEFVLALECGHRQTRTSCNFSYRELEDLFPRRVRCSGCPAIQTVYTQARKEEAC